MDRQAVVLWMAPSPYLQTALRRRGSKLVLDTKTSTRDPDMELNVPTLSCHSRNALSTPVTYPTRPRAMNADLLYVQRRSNPCGQLPGLFP
jgi:hypothetical protein